MSHITLNKQKIALTPAHIVQRLHPWLHVFDWLRDIQKEIWREQRLADTGKLRN